MLTPTSEQQKVLDEQQNCVVIAAPGSGKTYTIAEKIRRVLPREPAYRGVIAISYTNKASDELRRRSLLGGMNPKASFFGTIDKFLLTELIFPFGPRLFGRAASELQVVRFEELEPAEQEGITLDSVDSVFGEREAEWFGRLFRVGRIVLNFNGGAAVWILRKSAAARRYIAARYSWIFIDEYQDCDLWQHLVFVSCTRLGLRGVAVGDLNQSIYGFAKKESKYLESLLQDNSFRPLALTNNHRSHQSIVDYATRLLTPNYEPRPSDRVQVYYKLVDGDEIAIGRWIGEELPKIMFQYEVRAASRVGILVKSERSEKLVSIGLTDLGMKHRTRRETALDRDTTLWGGLFRSLFAWLYSAELTRYELVERYLDIDANQIATQRVFAELRLLKDSVAVHGEDTFALRDRFIAVARALLPGAENRGAVGSLMRVLGDKVAVASYIPPAGDEAQVMTLHKSKGLEFDVVFHMDLYKYILPNVYQNEQQDLNLHYVGITRARQACYLCSSTQRHKGDGYVVPAEPSPFLDRNQLPGLRIPL